MEIWYRKRHGEGNPGQGDFTRRLTHPTLFSLRKGQSVVAKEMVSMKFISYLRGTKSFQRERKKERERERTRLDKSNKILYCSIFSKGYSNFFPSR